MLYNLLVGIILGIGLILPGVSGGVLAVVFGIYEKIIDSINNFFKNKKENFLFLLPIIIGILVGVILFGKLLKFVFDEYTMQASFAFIGLILGGIPPLFKKIKEKGKVNIGLLLAALIISLLFFVLGNKSIDFTSTTSEGFIHYVKLFFTGFIFISGKVIPGISSSFMMMLIGMYSYILNMIADPINTVLHRFFELIPLGLGMVAGGILFAKLIGYALKKYHNITYSLIIGFVIGSIPAIYPGFEFNSNGILSILLLIAGFIGSYALSLLKFNKNTK